MQFYYLKQMGKNIYPRINLSYVEKFPIKDISKEQEKRIIKLVNDILNENKIETKNKLIEDLNNEIYAIYKVKEYKKIIEESLK